METEDTPTSDHLPAAAIIISPFVSFTLASLTRVQCPRSIEPRFLSRPKLFGWLPSIDALYCNRRCFPISTWFRALSLQLYLVGAFQQSCKLWNDDCPRHLIHTQPLLILCRPKPIRLFALFPPVARSPVRDQLARA